MFFKRVYWTFAFCALNKHRMSDDINFENVVEIFSTGVPPEVSHFINLVHPGRSWWLKTVIHHRPIQGMANDSQKTAVECSYYRFCL